MFQFDFDHDQKLKLNNSGNCQNLVGKTPGLDLSYLTWLEIKFEGNILFSTDYNIFLCSEECAMDII